MTRFTFASAVVAVAGTIVAAGACSSVPEVTYSDGTSSGGASSGNSTSGNSGGSSGTTSSSGDAQDVVSNCTPTGPEICDDGIDNDCNQKTDCADDACKPSTECVDPAPPGWTLISFSDATRPNCATGYEAPIDLKVVNGTGTGACTCDCAPTAGPACSAGTFAVSVDANSCNAATANLAPNANCTNLATPINVPPGQTVGKATPPPGPTTCGGTILPAAGPITFGRTCTVAPATKFGKGCGTTSQQCAPKAIGMNVCVTKLGTDACPSPYTRRLTAGTDATDTRACSATCNCDAKPCTGTVELFEAADCTTGGANKNTTGTLDTSCDSTTSKNFTAVRYKAALGQPTNGCAIAAGGFDSTMQGDIAWTEQRTVCCKP